MAMWGSVPVKNSIVPVLHLQIGIRNDVLSNLLVFIDSDVEKLSTGEEVAYSKLVTVNKVISKRRQDRQIWDVNDGVMLQHKALQIKRIQAIKESTLGINNDLGITITSSEIFVKKKK